MIQLQQQPPLHTLARNPVLYRWLATDADGNPYRAKGVVSEIRITDFSLLTNNDQVTVTWTEPDGTTGSQAFLAVDAYAGLDFQLPTANSPGYTFATATEYYTLVAEIMANHPVTSPLFTFSTVNRGAGQSYFVEAREVSNEWVLAFTVTAASLPHTIENVTTITATTLPDDHRVLWELFFENTYNDGGFERIAQGEEFINEDSILHLDLSRILTAAIEDNLGDPYVPAYSTAAPVAADNTRRYYLRYREEYDNIASPAWVNDRTAKVMNGGVSQSVFAGTPDWLGGLTIDTCLLTWKPDQKTIAVDQKEYLGWYNYTGSEVDLVLEYRGTREDGTQTTALYLYGSPNVNVPNQDTVLFPVSLTALGRTSDTDVVYYTVRVVDKSSGWESGSPTYLSPARLYHVDRTYHQSVRYLQYLNGYGCPETLRCTGYFTNTLRVDRDEAARILEPGYTGTAQQVQQHNEDYTNFFTYRTGHLPKLEMDSLQELFIRGRAYEIFESGYIPLQLTVRDMPVTETRRPLHNLTLVMKPALLARNYSNVLSTNPQDNDLWLVNDNSGYWLTIFGQRWQQV